MPSSSSCCECSLRGRITAMPHVPLRLTASCAWASEPHHHTSCPLRTSWLCVLEPQGCITAPRVPLRFMALCAGASGLHHHASCSFAPHSFMCLSLGAASPHLVSLRPSRLCVLMPQSRITTLCVPPHLTASRPWASGPRHCTSCPSTARVTITLPSLSLCHHSR